MERKTDRERERLGVLSMAKEEAMTNPLFLYPLPQVLEHLPGFIGFKLWTRGVERNSEPSSVKPKSRV